MTRAQDIEEIVVAAHALTRLAAAQTRNEAPAAQWRALSVLRADGPMRVGELARASRTTQPGMTRLVGQLEELGLVEKQADPADSRASVISATDAGATALAAWRVQLRDALEPLFDGLDDDDWSALSRVARILSSRTALEVAR
jgi:DNA-binding MarR family transcriptional regulator